MEYKYNERWLQAFKIWSKQAEKLSKIFCSWGLWWLEKDKSLMAKSNKEWWMKCMLALKIGLVALRCDKLINKIFVMIFKSINL